VIHLETGDGQVDLQLLASIRRSIRSANETRPQADRTDPGEDAGPVGLDDDGTEGHGGEADEFAFKAGTAGAEGREQVGQIFSLNCHG